MDPVAAVLYGSLPNVVKIQVFRQGFFMLHLIVSLEAPVLTVCYAGDQKKRAECSITTLNITTMMKFIKSNNTWSTAVMLALLISTVCVGDVLAQAARPTQTFYLRPQVGIASYVGDNNKSFFSFGESFPYSLGLELGYQFNDPFSLGVAYQLGNYPSVDAVDEVGLRHSAELIARYTFGGESGVAPYLQVGGHVTFGEVTTFGTNETEQNTSYGPLAGLGIDIPLSNSTSLYFEGNTLLTFPDDGVDGREGDRWGSFDLLSTIKTGLKFNFKSALRPPQILSLDGPSELETGQTGTFQANLAEETRGPAEYRWDWGDGTTSTGLTVSHTYTSAGNYTVQFTATNRAGSDTETMNVTVVEPPEPPQIVSVTANPNNPDTDTQVMFSANVNGDPPFLYNWDFGDGTTGTGATPSHRYQEEGTYTVSLTVTNDVGSDSQTLSLSVEAAVPAFCSDITELNSVYFGRNSSILTPEGRQSLDENVEILQECLNINARIEGWAAPGERNPDELSTDRARAVQQYYETEGIDSARLDTEGMGRPTGITSKKDGTSGYQRVDTIPIR